MSYTNRGSTDPKKLPCFTVGEEYKSIVDGYVAKALADLMAQPTSNEPHEIDEVEHLWVGGASKSDDWLAARLAQIGNKGAKK